MPQDFVHIFIDLKEYYEQPEEYSEDEEGQMVIDENPPTPENLSFDNRHTPSPASNNNNNFNNNESKWINVSPTLHMTLALPG